MSHIKKQQLAILSVFSFLFSVCVTLGRHIVFSGDTMAGLSENYMTPLNAADLLWLIAVFALTLTGLRLIVPLAERLSGLRSISERRHAGRFVLAVSLLLLVSWLPYILSLYPGSVLADSLNSIRQILNEGHPTSTHHPLMYTLLLGWCSKAGISLFGSVNAGVFLCAAIQVLLTLGAVVCVLRHMYAARLPWPAILLVLLFYMFMPLIPVYAMTLWKDPLYSVMLLVQSLLLYDLMMQEQTGWGWAVRYAIACMGVAFFRNNGIYVVIAASLLACLHFRRQILRIGAAVMLSVIVYAGFNSYAKAVWKVTDDFVESVGIPLQQMACVIAEDGKMSEDAREYLSYLMPLECWKEAYAPCQADAVKWDSAFYSPDIDAHKQWFFRTWCSMLKDNPASYVKAYLLETFGFWKIGSWNGYGYAAQGVTANQLGISRDNLLHRLTGMESTAVDRMLKNLPRVSSGTLLWLVLLACTLVSLRGRKYCLAYMPALMNWGTVMIAAPVAFSLRYVYIFLLGLPFYLLLPAMIACETKRRAD